jgi:hypothetical protein
MTLAYLLLPVGVVLLGTPGTLMTSSKVLAKMRQTSRRHELGLTSLARAGINWIDLSRAAAGAFIIQYALPLGSAGQTEIFTAYLGAQMAIIALSVVAQTVWLGKPIRVTGPLFYLSGLSIVICGPLVAGLAIPLGVGCALMVRRLSLSFVFVPFCIMSFAILFGSIGLLTVAVALGFLLPSMLSFSANGRIAYARNPKETRAVDRPDNTDASAERQDGPGEVIAPGFRTSQIKIAEESLI